MCWILQKWFYICSCVKHLVQIYNKKSIVVIIITESVIMERCCVYFCLVLGTVFLVMAFLIAWKYLFSMGLCYATAFLATETREH